MALLGIDIGGTSVKIGVVRAAPQMAVVKHGSIPTLPENSADDLVERIAAAAEEMIAAAGEAIEGVGIGCPGLIDPVRGIVTQPGNLPGLEGCALRDRLAGRLGMAAEIQNDANAAVLGEHLFGHNRGVNNLVLLTLGTGVGGGIIVDGRLLVGADNAAAELGHIKVQFRGGAACACGKTGCVEAYAGAAGIARMAMEGMVEGEPTVLRSSGLSTREISSAARAGDVVAKRVLHGVGEYLGRGIATLIETLNPEKVVIGGGASRAFDLLEGGIREALLAYASFPTTRDRTVIAASEFPDDVNLVGAAAVFLNLHR